MNMRFSVFGPWSPGGGLFAALLLFAFAPQGPIAACCNPGGAQAPNSLHPPAVALYRFRAFPGSDPDDAMGERAGLIASLLGNALSMSDRVSLLDRTALEGVFREMALRRGQVSPGERAPLLPKLPLSDYTVTGSLYADEQRDQVAVRVVRNRDARVVGIAHWPWREAAPANTVAKVSAWVINQVLQDRRQAEAVDEREHRLAFAGFECLDEDTQCLQRAARFSDRLNERYLNNGRYPLVARTQLVPLVVEDILRSSQYMDKVPTIKDRDARYLVHGKLGNNGNGHNSKSLYLYIEDVLHGRRLEVITADEWDSLYRQAEEAVERHLQLSAYKPDPASEVARQRFVQALKTLRRLSSQAEEFDRLQRIHIDAFKGEATPQRSAARALLTEALEADHGYLPAQLIDAYLSSDRSDAMATIERIAYSGNPQVESAAFALLEQHRRTEADNITPALFAGIVDRERATQLVEQLKREGYLNTVAGTQVRIRTHKHSDALITRPHALSLAGLSRREAVQVFERLRQLIYRPGSEVRYITPRRYHPRDLADYRQKWSQRQVSSFHRRESVLQQELGKSLARIDIVQLGEMGVPPSILAWGQRESASLRRSRLAMGLDAFASSAFVEPGNLQPLVLLGHTLCLEAIDDCELGRLVNSWVVAYADSAYPDRRHGGLVNRDKEQDEVDNLLFLAASAVNRLAEANLTAFTRSMDYYKEALAASSQREMQKTGGDADRHRRSQVAAYVDEIRTRCNHLQQRRSDMKSLRRVRKYTEAMNALAELATKDEMIHKLRTQPLKAIESACSEAYPYLVIAMEAKADFLSHEQDEMVWRVLEKQHLPALRSRFVEHSFTLFEKRVEAEKMDVARRYLQLYERYYGINRESVLDFTYLYHRLDDEATAQRLLHEHGRSAFQLSGYPISAINGHYEMDGFDARHRLRYRNRDNPRSTIYYEGERVRYGMGKKPSRWSLRLEPTGTAKKGKRRYYSGNRNPDHPDKFCFDNGGRITGDIHWPGDSREGKHRVAEKEGRGSATPEHSALPPVELLEPLTQEERQSGDASTLSLGYRLDPSGRFALKANTGAFAAGPLRPSHFPKPLAASHDVNGLIERLFANGYLSVSGVPNVEPGYRVRKMLERDFPDLTLSERRWLKEAYFAATKMGQAGHVELYRRTGDAWDEEPPLTATDATARSGFGRAVSVSEHHVFVCDFRNGLYIFRRDGLKWRQRQRLDVNCGKVAGNEEWVAVQASGKVVLFANGGDGWHHHQDIHPYDHLLREDAGVSFEYFGNALALSGNELFVADSRYKGGEISRYELSGGKWQERERLASPDDAFWFGRTLLATDGYLAVGMDGRNGQVSTPARTELLLLYRRQEGGWQPVHRLAPADTKTRDFANWLWLSHGEAPFIYITSKQQLFHYPMPHD